MKIPNAVTVITGGASGLGESAVRLFKSLGSKVAIWDTDAARGEKLAKELGPEVIFGKTDVVSEDSVKSSLSETLKAFGKVNILVNSAGIFRTISIKPESTTTLADFENIIRVNLIGTFNVCRLVAKEMCTQPEIENERGVIINLSSTSYDQGQWRMLGYATSKGGISGMTLPMARDLANYKIRVNAIAPGFFSTPMVQSAPQDLLDDFVKLTLPGILGKRLGEPSEFAHAVQFLVENAYMNGTILRLDSGVKMTDA